MGKLRLIQMEIEDGSHANKNTNYIDAELPTIFNWHDRDVYFHVITLLFLRKYKNFESSMNGIRIVLLSFDYTIADTIST